MFIYQKSKGLIWLMFIISTLLAISCQSEKAVAERELIKPVTEVITDTVTVEHLNSMIEVTGVISFNEENVLKLYPVTGGRVETVNVELGDFVKKGNVLAVVKSRDIVNLKNELNAAEANLIVAKKNLQATEEMFSSGIISEREYLTAQKEISKINSELDKIKSTMAIYSGHNSSEYLIKAPMSGYIVEKNMISGMQIREDNAEPVFTIANFNNLWVMINVFETDIDRVRIGDIATIKTIAYPNEIIEGKIDKIFNVIDSESRTMRARVIVPNKELKLKPGMFAFISLGSSQTSEHLTVAAEAVVFKDSKNYVVVVEPDGYHSLRQVELGQVINNRQIVKSGLSVGEQYVLTDNLFLTAKIIEQNQ